MDIMDKPVLSEKEIQWLRHHMGNMLAVIKQNAEFIKQTDDADLSEAAIDILVAVGRAEDTLNDLSGMEPE